MLKHIVMWRFKDSFEGKTKEEMMEQQRTDLLKLPEKIDWIRSMQIGKDILHSEKSYDMALVMDFDNMDDMVRYREFPDHVVISTRMKDYVTDRVVVDYEF